MERGQSGRADGRGWGGRGDSNPRRDEPAGGSPPAEDRLRGPGDAPPPAEDRLRGPGDSPWVRLGDASAGGAGRSGPTRPAPPDLSALLVALEGMRGMVPRDISAQLTALMREVLLTLRALIDWYLERLDGPPREPEVEEIPID